LQTTDIMVTQPSTCLRLSDTDEPVRSHGGDVYRRNFVGTPLELLPPLISHTCHTTLRNVSGQLYCFAFTLATIICFVSSDICFTSFYLFVYFFFLILRSLWRYCSILFVALLIRFSYEDKRLA